MMASLPARTRATTALAVVLLAAALVHHVPLASASVHAGFSPTHAPPLAITTALAPAPGPSAAPPHPAPPRVVLPRKVLRPPGTDVSGGARPHRVDEGCAGADDIAIYQGRATTLPTGVPAYTVDVMNRCSGGGDDGGDCAIAGIHVRCGWFSSVSLVDPRKFRRLARDDCLINDGQPILAGETLTFEYANSFPYQLSVAVATCVVDPSAANRP